MSEKMYNSPYNEQQPSRAREAIMNVNGHSWVVEDFEEVNGVTYYVVIVFTISNGELLSKELKRERL